MISPPLRQVLREPPGLQKRWDASSPDQPNGEIDFHAWLPCSEISLPKCWSERREKDWRESIKINFRVEVFLSVT